MERRDDAHVGDVLRRLMRQAPRGAIGARCGVHQVAHAAARVHVVVELLGSAFVRGQVRLVVQVRVRGMVRDGGALHVVHAVIGRVAQVQRAHAVHVHVMELGGSAVGERCLQQVILRHADGFARCVGIRAFAIGVLERPTGGLAVGQRRGKLVARIRGLVGSLERELLDVLAQAVGHHDRRHVAGRVAELHGQPFGVVDAVRVLVRDARRVAHRLHGVIVAHIDLIGIGAVAKRRRSIAHIGRDGRSGANGHRQRSSHGHAYGRFALLAHTHPPSLALAPHAQRRRKRVATAFAAITEDRAHRRHARPFFGKRLPGCNASGASAAQQGFCPSGPQHALRASALPGTRRATSF